MGKVDTRCLPSRAEDDPRSGSRDPGGTQFGPAPTRAEVQGETIFQRFRREKHRDPTFLRKDLLDNVKIEFERKRGFWVDTRVS